jgi:hypothetical protein
MPSKASLRSGDAFLRRLACSHRLVGRPWEKPAAVRADGAYEPKACRGEKQKSSRAMKARLQPPRERLRSYKRSMSFIIRVALWLTLHYLCANVGSRWKRQRLSEMAGFGRTRARFFRPPSRTRLSLPVPSYWNFYDLIYGVLLL